MVKQKVVLAKVSDAQDIYCLIELEAKAGHLLHRSLVEIKSLIRKRRFYVVRISGKVVACGSLERPRFEELRSFVVDSRFRGLGLSSKIVRRVQFDATTKKLPQMMAVTSRTDIFRNWDFNFTTETERTVMFWYPKGKKAKR